MTDLVWPNGVRQSVVTWRHISNTDVSSSPYSGAVQTVSRPGDRLGCVVTVHNSTGAERAKLRALAAALRGRTNRIYLADLSETGRRRGSFPAPELFSNSDFSNGSTGWSALSGGSISAADGVAKLSVASPGGSVAFYQLLSPVQYAPYVLRSIIVDGAASSGLSLGPSFTLLSGVLSASSPSTSRVYSIASGVYLDSGSNNVYPVVFSTTTGYYAATSVLIPFVSFARCFLVDGGANLLQRSDEFDNAYWGVNNTTISANADVGPDGSTTADYMRENGSASTHYVGTASAITGISSSNTLEYSLNVALKAGNRSWCYIQISETTGSTTLTSYFNLTTGAVGTVAAGANWAQQRANITSMGNGWYRCSVIGRKTNAATSFNVVIGAASADNTPSYTGTDSSVATVLGRASLAQSSATTRLRQTTSAAASAETQTGAAIYVKGLPASSSGLLKRGDLVEIDKQIKFVQADLDSDAGGTAVLLIDSPPARALSDNTPIIVQTPMAKFYLKSDVEYPSEPGTPSSTMSDFTFEFEQDLNS